MAAYTLLAHRRAVAAQQMSEDMRAVGEALGIQLPEEPKGRFPDANHEYTARTEWLSVLIARIRDKVAPRPEPLTPEEIMADAQREDQGQGTTQDRAIAAGIPSRESGLEGRRVPPVAGSGVEQSQDRLQREPTEVVDDEDFEGMKEAEQGQEPMFVGHPLSYYHGKTDEEIKATAGVGKRTFKAIKDALGQE